MKNSFNILNSLAKFETASDRLIFFAKNVRLVLFVAGLEFFLKEGIFGVNHGLTHY